MPQTMLALFGIVLASVLMLHQSRSGILTDRRTEAAEVQALAAEVAVERMARLEALAFDQAVVDDYADAPAELTPFAGGSFVPLGPDAPGDDLDDANNESIEAPYALREGAAGGAVGGIELRTTVTVRYVDEGDGETVTSVPTRFKRATVTVAPVATGDAVAKPVVLTQMFSCGSYCTW